MISTKMGKSYQPTRNHIILGIISTTTILLVVGVAFSTSAQSWLLRWSGVLSGFGTLILTGFLVVLYRQQKDLLAAEQRPVVEVENHWAENEDMFIALSNYGKGVATDLELVTVSVVTEASHLGSGIDVRRLTREPGESEDKRRGQAIKELEDYTTFKARPGLPLSRKNEGGAPQATLNHPDPRTSGYGFETGLRELKRNKTEVLRLHFYVRYKDLQKNHQLKHVISVELDGSSGGDSVEDVLNQGGRMISGEPTVSDPNLSFDLSSARTDADRTVI